MKIILEGTELFHAGRRIDRRTDINRHGCADMTKLIVVFCNFANAPKIIKTKEILS